MKIENHYDLLLQGGRVIDPANGLDGPADVAVAGDRIARVAPGIEPSEAVSVVNVSGLLVTPGLLDIHAHVYHTKEPGGLSVMADSHCPRSGVTTVMDPGTAGAGHFAHFKETVIDRAQTRILALVNIVGSGMLGEWEQDVCEMDANAAAATVAANPDVCIGIKTAHYWTHKPCDDLHPPWAAVERAIQAGELCGKTVMFDFWPRVERPYEELLLKRMRPGDIHTHVFAQQFPILDSAGRPNAFLREARERGVLFDVGHGAASFWFRQAVPAIAHGFVPDTISTDLHTRNVNGPVIDMLTTMSKLLNMGLSASDVIARSTVAAARAICRPELGTLSPGAEADIAVLKLEEGEFRFTDCGKTRLTGSRRLECAMTLRAGKVLYDPTGLSMPEWTDAPAA